MDKKEDRPYWQAAHQAAVDAGQDTYVDPITGYVVFTELFLKLRGYCCESGCRHCPYDKKSIKI